MAKPWISATLAALAVVAVAGLAYGHGDVIPQPVNTDALPDIGNDWLDSNPYRADKAGQKVWAKAVEIGSSGFNQNCARCHGLGAISGGLAPDLRYLSADDDGDSWFVERFQHGYTQNGTTKMPAFGPILGQKAGWAIRTYIETRPDQDELDKHADRLAQIRDTLAKGDPGDEAALKDELQKIAQSVPTLSGAPVADSIAFDAANQLNGTKEGEHQAAETLTIGLSAAK